MPKSKGTPQPKREVLSRQSNGLFEKEIAHYETVGDRSECVSVLGSGGFANYSAETERGSDWPS